MRRTFDDLWLEEIVHDNLDAIDGRHHSQCLREVLQDQLSRKLWECLDESCTLMAEAATNINQDVLPVEIPKLLLEWKSRQPGYSTRSLHGHDLLEIPKPLRLARKPDKPRQFCAECLLQGCLAVFCHIFIFSFGEEVWQLLQDRPDCVEALPLATCQRY